MAFTSQGSLGTGVRTASGTSTTITTSQACNIGDFVVVCCAKDNTGTTDVASTEFSGCTVGTNTFLKAGEFRNSAGAAADGAVVAVYYFTLTQAIANGGTITVAHDSQTDVALSAWRWTIGAGNTVTLTSSATPVVDDATAHGTSIAISSLTSQEYLFFRGTAIEDEALTTQTATANHTLITGLTSTTSGVNASNIFCAGEWRILSGTGDTSNPTFTTAASAQGVSVFYAFDELNLYTLTAATQSYVLTRNAGNFVRGYVFTADSASFVRTGNAASLLQNRKLIAATTSFVETGVAVNLLQKLKLTAATAAFVETGVAAGLLQKRILSAGVGAFTETGQAADFHFGFSFAAATGAFTETGNAATLARSWIFTAATTSFTETGSSAGLLYGRLVSAGTGAYTETGQAAPLYFGRKLVGGTGAFTETGSDAALSRTFVLSAGTTSFACAGTDTSFSRTRVFPAGTSAFALTGQAVGLTYATSGASVMSAGIGAFTATGSVTGLIAQRRLVAETAAVTETGAATGLFFHRRLSAGTGAFVGTGSPTIWGHGFRADTGSYLLAGQDAGLDFAASTSPTMLTSAGVFALGSSDTPLRRTFRRTPRSRLQQIFVQAPTAKPLVVLRK